MSSAAARETDARGLANGRFLLTTSAEGADCVPTTRSADLTLDVGTLGTLYLGDRPASRLAALGRIAEHTPGAAVRADRLLGTARRPWTQDVF
jgi:predicted acetyltransferase